MPNEDLVRRAQAGDREAFDALMTSAVDRLLGIARMILHDLDAAEDAVQDALVRCWQDLPALRSADRFDAWLHRLLVNAVLDESRRRRRQSRRFAALRWEPSVTDVSRDLADRDALENAFARLSVDHRASIVLHFYLGMNVDQAAAILGIRVGTAKSRLHYATRALRAALEADDRRHSAGEVLA
ncbi:MAG TPA: RNA polymerase sigma factor [Candidatus Limnocylindrales bacterium]|nr:RNA polymerase sigma factor [Candidatus Limnocylindrales bacterium]